MIQELEIPLFDLVTCLSETVDMVNPAVARHHKQVAYTALSIAAELGLSALQQSKLALAGALHDLGALSVKERIESLQFEIDNPYRHAELGFLLLKNFKPLSRVATLIRFHHISWNKGAGSESQGERVPLGSHILHLADRAVVLLKKGEEVLGQVEEVCQRLQEFSGRIFRPDLVDAFLSLASKEFFWFDVVSPAIGTILSRRVRLVAIDLNVEELLGLARLFSRIIDFRSPVTATHSSGVAACAETLASLVGFSKRECLMIRAAGYLHDLGKLVVPAEILEKPANLSPEEFNIIKSHAFHTYRVLENVAGLDLINSWAALHHERLDGTGYPFHLKGQDLPVGAQIMAVADVFTAVTEDRPYRKGMDRGGALQVLEKMAQNSALNPNLVSLLRVHYEQINSIRVDSQAGAATEYQEFRQAGGWNS